MPVMLHEVVYDVTKLVNTSIGIWLSSRDIVTWTDVPVITDRVELARQIAVSAGNAVFPSGGPKVYSFSLRQEGSNLRMKILLEGVFNAVGLGLDTPTSAVYPTVYASTYASWAPGDTEPTRAEKISFISDVLARGIVSGI